VFAIADEMGLGDDLRAIVSEAQGLGFRVVGYHPRRSPVARWLKFGLEVPGKQRPGLFWVIPEAHRSALRVEHADVWLERLLAIPPDCARNLFGSGRDRDYGHGESGDFIKETLRPLGELLKEEMKGSAAT